MLAHTPQAMLKEAKAFGKSLSVFEKAVKKFEGGSGTPFGVEEHPTLPAGHPTISTSQTT